MKKFIGHIRKLKGEPTCPVSYYFRLGDKEIPLNSLMGNTLSFVPTGNIQCIQCGRKTNKSFQQGFCFPCLRRLQECNLCVIHPERCQVESGTCSTEDWAHVQCAQTHIIYLANSSGLKVGITRETQVPTRWIDQGASQAIPIFKVSNRYQAGVMEVALKQFVNDRTDWRALLKNDAEPLDLLRVWSELRVEARAAIQRVFSQFPGNGLTELSSQEITQLNYPVVQYPEKINSLSLDAEQSVSGKLMGIKGQYLIFDNGVINIRKFGGYEVEFHVRHCEAPLGAAEAPRLDRGESRIN